MYINIKKKFATYINFLLIVYYLALFSATFVLTCL